MINSKSEISKKLNRTYREPIQIQMKQKAEQLSDGTWLSGNWKDFRKVFANIKNLYGRELEEARQHHKEETTKFYIRFIPGINNEVKEEYRIIYRGKIYNIDFVDNINYLDEELEIKAIERKITDGSK